MTADVAIIGAGFAGLSAGVRLADAGLRVVVLEEAPRLGGRATAFTDRESGERIDNGQHVLFGCYRQTYAFLRRLGTDRLAPLQDRLTLTMAGPDGRHSRLVCPPWHPPWHLLAGVLRWRAVPIADRLTSLRLRRLLKTVRREGARAAAGRVPPDQTVAAWLSDHGQAPALSNWLWRPLAIAALNQSPDEAAAAPFVRVLGELFGPRVEDSAIGLSSVPLDALYAEPAARLIEKSGGAVLTKSPARLCLDQSGRVAGVQAGAMRVETPAVISAVPWHALARIWDRDAPAPVQAVVSNATSTGSSPIVTVNLWFDGRVMSEPFIGLVAGPMHWVFDKSAIFGEKAGHLSVVASGADDLARLDNEHVTSVVRQQLAQAVPATASSRLLRSVVVREHRATFSLAPGSPPRPATVTALDGFYLAGDWTDTGLPGTIEGAVVSGHAAADAMLERHPGPPGPADRLRQGYGGPPKLHAKAEAGPYE